MGRDRVIRVEGRKEKEGRICIYLGVTQDSEMQVWPQELIRTHHPISLFFSKRLGKDSCCCNSHVNEGPFLPLGPHASEKSGILLEPSLCFLHLRSLYLPFSLQLFHPMRPRPSPSGLDYCKRPSMLQTCLPATQFTTQQV